MKRTVFVISEIIIIIIYVYILNISNIPNNIIIFEDENLDIKTLFGISYEKFSTGIDNSTIQASAALNKSVVGEKSRLSFKLFNKIKLKEVELDVISNVKVVPVGNTIGLKLYTKGVLVVGMNEIQNEENNTVKPYENTGIIEGDMIISINDNAITCTADLLKEVNQSNGKELQVEYVRNGNVYEADIKPEKIEENTYKLGLWVRDSAAGVGTITYYEPSTGKFAALGHGIMDIDTGDLLEIADGEIVTTNIISIVKGEKKKPGEIRGSIVNQSAVGKISKNTKIGIYGLLTNSNALDIDLSKQVEVARRSEIKLGTAKILCTLENNKTQEYDIEIQKIDLNNNDNNKSMVIKVTDEELLKKTNGIIQGMSGSPIIQNGKLIGAVTQVFLASPDMGYGIFADLMIKEMKEVE